MKRIISAFIFVLVLSFSIVAQTIIRGPYLQNVTKNSINILWRTDIPTTSRVEVGVDSNNLNLIYHYSTITSDHNILVNNLEPNTKYYYTLYGKMYHFKTSPNEIKKTTFWAIGDFGIGNQNQINVRQSFVNSKYAKETNFWLWLGDNAYPDGTDSEYQRNTFSKNYGYDSIMKFLPFFATPGNHDYRSIDKKTEPHTGVYYDIIEVPTKGEGGGLASNTKMYYSFDYNDIHFISLNSEAYNPARLSQSEMINWLKEDLKQNSKKWTVVFLHQPPYTKGSHNSDNPSSTRIKAVREVIIPILEQYGVDLVLTGHSHVYERSYLLNGHYGNSFSFNKNKHIVQDKSGSDLNYYTKKLYGEEKNKGTIYVVVGNSGKNFNGTISRHPAMYHYENGNGSLIIEIENNKLDGVYIRSNGEIGDNFSIIKIDTIQNEDTIITNISYNKIIKNINLFPIPINNELFTTFSLNESANIKINLYDISGKFIYTLYNSFTLSGRQNIKLNINRNIIPSGIYLINFEINNNITVKKVIFI